MSYAWGAGGAGQGQAIAPLHASVGIVQVDLGGAGSAGAPPGVAMPGPERPVVAPMRPSVDEGQAVDDDRPADLELRRLAAELAPMVDVWQRLLAQHTPDRAGRCQTCTKGGTGLPAIRWPCSIHGIAELARRCHDRSA